MKISEYLDLRHISGDLRIAFEYYLAGRYSTEALLIFDLKDYDAEWDRFLLIFLERKQS